MTPPDIDERPRRRQPLWPLVLLALAAGVVVQGMAGGSGPLGRLFAGLLGAPEGETLTLPAQLMLGAAGGVIVFAIAWLIRPLRFALQVGIVWLALLLAFLAFAYNFDLKYSLILEKLPFLAGLRLAPDGFVQGALMTLFVSVISIGFSSLLGFAAGLGRMSKNAVAFGVATFYISFFRGTPLLLQIYLIYLGLPNQLDIVLSAITSGVIALSLNYGAYLAEINRAGIEAVDRGQREAATALGLKPWAVMWKIVLPQAMRVIIPPTFSQFIAMLKDSSLVSLLGVWELTFLSRSYGRADFRYIEMLLTAAMLYWIMSILFELMQVRIERYYGKGFTGRSDGQTRPHLLTFGHH